MSQFSFKIFTPLFPCARVNKPHKNNQTCQCRIKIPFPRTQKWMKKKTTNLSNLKENDRHRNALGIELCNNGKRLKLATKFGKDNSWWEKIKMVSTPLVQNEERNFKYLGERTFFPPLKAKKKEKLYGCAFSRLNRFVFFCFFLFFCFFCL